MPFPNEGELFGKGAAGLAEAIVPESPGCRPERRRFVRQGAAGRAEAIVPEI
jgi:hypothetical protein